MIKYYKADNSELLPGIPFTINGIQYPSNWLALATSKELMNAGITQVTIPDPVPQPTPAPTLSDIKAAKLLEISSSADTQISISRFTSSALGVPYDYYVSVLDQQNLMGNILSSLLPGLPTGWTTMQKCTPIGTNAWQYVPHTASQIQQVGVDSKAFVMSVLLKKEYYIELINSPTITADQVKAISWQYP